MNESILKKIMISVEDNKTSKVDCNEENLNFIERKIGFTFVK